MFRIWLLFLLSAGWASAQPLLPASNLLFDDTVLPTVQIDLDPADLDRLLEVGSQGSDEEFPARLIFDKGTVQDTVFNVGFRIRGNTSRQSAKKSFKVSFNTFERGKKYQGLEKLNLNGEHNDPSIIRSKLSWDLFQTLRVPAARAAHTRLVINGTYYGLYINVEHIDEQFLKSRFGNDAGTLYKCLWPADLAFMGPNPDAYRPGPDRRPYDLKLRDHDDEGYVDLAAFIDALNNTPDAVFPETIEAVFDVNGFLRILAADVALGSWDDYWFLKNNFYLYHNPGTDRFVFIPYDYDNTLGIDFLQQDWGTRNVYDWGHPSEVRPLADRILNIQEYRNRYTFYLRRLLEGPYQPDALFPRIDALQNRITSAMLSDTFRGQDWGFSVQDFFDSYTEALGGHVAYGLKPFIETRRTTALAQLDVIDVAPILSDARHSPRRPQTDSPLSFRVWVEDETVDQLDVTLVYQVGATPEQQLSLHDDGQHEDEAALDGIFGGQLPPLNQRTTLTYRIEATEPGGRRRRTPPQTLSIGYDVPAIVINEFMARNTVTLADTAGAFEDWIELYNAGDVSVNLNGFHLSDNLAVPNKWALPAVDLDAGAFLLIWADEDGNEGDTHANFRLNQNGEQIGLFLGEETDFAPVDTLTFGLQETDISTGRMPDGTEGFVVQTHPTPGQPNGMPVPTQTDTPAAYFTIQPLYPNPFQDQTAWTLTLSQPSHVTVSAFNVLGQRNLHRPEQTFSSGTHRMAWNATSESAGLYFLHVVLRDDSGRTDTVVLKGIRM